MKLIKALLLILLSFTFFFGCAQEIESKITTIEDVDVQKLSKYSGTYVGDNSSVSAIVKELAGGETYQEIDLSNQQLKVTYGVNEQLGEEFQNFWYKGDEQLKEKLLFNMFYLTLLVPNANEYILQLPDTSIEVSRNDMMQFISIHLEQLPSADEFFNQDIMKKYIADHYKEWEELIQSESFKEDFYHQYPLS